MKAVVLARVLYHQALDMAADGAQLESAQLRRRPRREGHAAAVFGQNLGVGRVGLGPAQRLGKAVDQLRIQHRDLDALGLIQRQRKVQRVNAGSLQRYTRRHPALPQPGDQRPVAAGSVVKNTFFEPLIFLSNSDRQCRRTHVDATKCHRLLGLDRLAHGAP